MTAASEVIVVGLGAMGSATLLELARRGHRVTGIDRFTPPHTNGSSHGRSRIIREAYFEDPRYVPLVQRAYQRWQALEDEGSVTIFRQTGGLMLGNPASAVVRGALASARDHGLAHEVLDAEAIRRRFPAFRLQDSEIGVFEPRAGTLDPELAIATALRLARRHGAELRLGETFRAWRSDGEGVEVVTDAGTLRAGHLVLAVGPWAPEIVGELALPFVVQRNLLFWFTPVAHPEHFGPGALPVFIHETAPGEAWYGFPDVGDGVKVARHHHGETTTPAALRRTVTDAELTAMRSILRAHMPDADGPLRETAACMYTTVPDDHFVIDTHPASRAVTVASPCSGHGFKFASAIGEGLADMATGRPVAFDRSLFALARFAAGP